MVLYTRYLFHAHFLPLYSLSAHHFPDIALDISTEEAEEAVS
jgi:hypothetical protein